MEKFYLIEDMVDLMREAGLRIGSPSGVRKALAEDRFIPPTGRTVARRIFVWSARDARRAVNAQRRLMVLMKYRPLLYLKRKDKERRKAAERP
jgi:hypothetical protein